MNDRSKVVPGPSPGSVPEPERPNDVLPRKLERRAVSEGPNATERIVVTALAYLIDQVDGNAEAQNENNSAVANALKVLKERMDNLVVMVEDVTADFEKKGWFILNKDLAATQARVDELENKIRLYRAGDQDFVKAIRSEVNALKKTTPFADLK